MLAAKNEKLSVDLKKNGKAPTFWHGQQIRDRTKNKSEFGFRLNNLCKFKLKPYWSKVLTQV